MNRILLVCFLFALVNITSVKANVTLPKIFSDNMVLQRDKPLAIWGWADPNEAITVSFNGQKIKSKADGGGRWSLSLKPMTSGGPYVMELKGNSGAIQLKNILIGDVWICSGQSNMEWIIKNTNDAANEIAQSNYPKIRLFTVEKAMSFELEKDLKGGTWLECNPQTVGDFSAVAYFFGRKIVKEIDVPIGLINTSWGGTNIQTWMSWDVMSKKDEYKNISLTKLKQSTETLRVKRDKFDEALKTDKGMQEKWFASSSMEGWKKINQPQSFESSEIGNADGVVWFQKEFELSSDQAGKAAILNLGPIDDQDETYLNGQKVGSMHVWNENRNYNIAAGLAHPGENVIIIKVTDTGGGGGLQGKPEQLYYETEGNKISLAGEWNYKPSALTTDFGIKDTGPNSFPSQLYNAMVAPIVHYAIKGALWYQGESNTWEAYRYRTLFPEMITDWRNKWGYDFPFFWVQLANFMAPDKTPAQSDWAELREAQTMTMSLPNTGEAVIIDIGEANDIHPRNKQDVGYRLALTALKTAYAKDLVYTGPSYKSMKKDGNKIVIEFANTGNGLLVKDKYGYVKGFAIAGDDQKFVWAKAFVDDDDKIIVYSDEIKNPVAVRYAWANNPDDVNLYNKEGLPATPFRTDTWRGVTQGN
jgi:sialate O-acetylesterase